MSKKKVQISTPEEQDSSSQLGMFGMQDDEQDEPTPNEIAAVLAEVLRPQESTTPHPPRLTPPRPTPPPRVAAVASSPATPPTSAGVSALQDGEDSLELRVGAYQRAAVRAKQAGEMPEAMRWFRASKELKAALSALDERFPNPERDPLAAQAALEAFAQASSPLRGTHRQT